MCIIEDSTVLRAARPIPPAVGMSAEAGHAHRICRVRQLPANTAAFAALSQRKPHPAWDKLAET
jgi:hypothetical protein